MAKKIKEMATENTDNLESTDKVMKFSDVVKFKVSYPKDFKKAKHFAEGQEVELHKMQADDWEKRGLGKIVK
jgi:hypothetical protein